MVHRGQWSTINRVQLIVIFVTPIILLNYQIGQLLATANPCGEPYNNWDYEAQDLRCWMQQKSSLAPAPAIAPPFADGENGSPFETHSVRLGDANGKEISPLGQNGYVAIRRSLNVPVIENPRLQFEFLMYSFDIIASSAFPYDTFEVAINNLTSVVWRIGNPTPDGAGCLRNVWRSAANGSSKASIDLSPYIGQTIDVYFVLRNQTDNRCNSWVYLDNIKLQPEIVISKTNNPSGPVHESDTINYTILYTNTSLITQTITITDVLPFNLKVEPDSINPVDKSQIIGKNIVWNIGNIPPNTSGQVSFKARVALLPSLYYQDLLGTMGTPGGTPAYVLPAPVGCETTRFWANGVTRQPPIPNPHTIQLQIPPDVPEQALEIWISVSGPITTAPTVGGEPAELVAQSNNSSGASIWSADVTPEMIEQEQISVVTYAPCELNAVFLFSKNDPPFELAALDDFASTTKTFSYPLEIPSVATQTIDVLLPIMDLTYWTNNLQPNTRLTTVTVRLNDQSHTILANQPNLGNGLLMTHFPFKIGPYTDTITSTKVLEVSINTEEFIYTLGPRVCRPVYIENTAWLCSQQAGCIADTVTNIPKDFSPPRTGIYLPIIVKGSSA